MYDPFGMINLDIHSLAENSVTSRRQHSRQNQKRQNIDTLERSIIELSKEQKELLIDNNSGTRLKELVRK